MTATATIVTSITTEQDAPSSGTSKSVILFWAPWHEGCRPGGPMDDVFSSIAESSSDDIKFFKVEAEALPSLSKKYNVSMVPTVVLLDENASVIDKIEGMNIPKVTQSVHALLSSTTGQKQQQSPTPAPQQEEETVDAKCTRLVKSAKVVLFMKGQPNAPRCGFSRQIVELLENEHIEFTSYDILDENAQDVRQHLKTMFDWPTYPQLYVKGDLVGGLDIIKEMIDEAPGELADQLGIEKKTNINERLKALVNRSKVMLFMKGLPSAPKCGFSRQICDILNSFEISYDAFDILQDPDVRQGLKTYSDWPTYPQLYVNGDLIGGLDIVKEMNEDGSLKDLLTQ